MNKTEALIKKARIALNSGDINNARKHIYKISNHGNNHEALNILALCSAIGSEHSQAEELFKKICSLTKPTDTILTNLGLTQLHQQKLSEAIESFLKAIKYNPKNTDALSNLAACYDHINDNDQAIFYANKAYKLKDDIPAVINIIAKHAHYNNDINKAINLYQHSLSIQPQPQIFVQLSNANYIAKEYVTAEKTLKQGISLFPDGPYLHNALGNFYTTRNRHDEAINTFNSVLSKHTGNIPALVGKVRNLIALQKFQEAETILKNAHKEFNDNADINAELCNFLILTKKYDKSYEISKLYLATKSIDEVPVNILDSHSTACRHSSRYEEAKKVLSTIIDRNNNSKETLESIYYSMGDTLDKMEDYNSAFHHYKLANEIIPKPSDINYYEAILSALKNSIDKSFIDNIGTSNNKSKVPVFIVGMPRSGTSLIEQILSSHPDVYGGGELTELWKIGNNISGAMNMLEYIANLSKTKPNDLERYSNSYLEKLSSISNGQSRVTDKLPHNFMHIGLIECLFPNAKVIHCQRHPFDTCLSIYFRQFNDNNIYAKNLGEIARFYKKYMDLMEHWNKTCSLSIFTAVYENMITNQEDQSKHLFEHIELSWDESTLNYFESDRIIMTPSAHQANKPIYTDSMYRWKHYQEHIEPLVKILGEPKQYE